MNTDWETAIEFVLKMEGGETAENNPNDPGGVTKFGISKKAYPNLDVANLTRDEAKEIYRRDYWEACRCDELPTPLAIAVFDTAVNQGVGTARRLLQVALGVIADGIIGEQTISAAHKVGPKQINKFLLERLTNYMRLMKKNNKLLYWGETWFGRVRSLADLIF